MRFRLKTARDEGIEGGRQKESKEKKRKKGRKKERRKVVAWVPGTSAHDLRVLLAFCTPVCGWGYWGRQSAPPVEQTSPVIPHVGGIWWVSVFVCGNNNKPGVLFCVPVALCPFSAVTKAPPAAVRLSPACKTCNINFNRHRQLQFQLAPSTSTSTLSSLHAMPPTVSCSSSCASYSRIPSRVNCWLVSCS